MNILESTSKEDLAYSLPPVSMSQMAPPNISHLTSDVRIILTHVLAGVFKAAFSEQTVRVQNGSAMLPC